jgi:DNA-directed RNA polymerase subunit RPC12/RpoP
MVKCNHCHAEFESDEELERHIEAEHSTSPDADAVGKRITCPECGAELSSQETLEVHMHDAHAA